jgi:lipopolysaccharide/colanic/teichoic acid biosynthesis glycosyltransferase
MVNFTVKRTFDIIMATIGIIVLWPFGILIAIAVILSSRGPALFLQKRIGRHGKMFNCIKFRTMYSEASRSGFITTASDMRITPLGKYLRKFKLDELPQLLNVLTGKMSFVGPRPDVPGYADRLEGEDRKILLLRPGITGPASIYFRNEEDLLAGVRDPKAYNDQIIWPQKVRLNKKYLENWSFWKDIGFILITIIPPLNKWLKLVEEPDFKSRTGILETRHNNNERL